MKGYKAFDENLTCRGMKYEVGETYEMDETPVCCSVGFHFCKNIKDVYNYYPMSDSTRICEVEALGEVVNDDSIKYCTNKIKIVKEIKNKGIKHCNTDKTSVGYCNSGNLNSGNLNSGNSNSGNWNSGDWNSGNRNTGNWNSGNWNTGSRNSGNSNTGNWNTGNWNSGDLNTNYYNSGDKNSGTCNSGTRNSGNRNSGSWNTGTGNSGDCNTGSLNAGYRNTGNFNTGARNSGSNNSGNLNTGDWNSGNQNSGIFNTLKEPKIKIFDKDSDWTMRDWISSSAKRILETCPCTHSDFIFEAYMTDAEKEAHKEYKTIGGYTKVYTVTKEDKQKWWDSLSDKEKEACYDLPNFDENKFVECLGIEHI